MSITLNGQLLLSMLCEQLADISQILQANTDGVTIKIHKSKMDRMYEICKEWEDLTQLELEYAEYSKMVIRDVNNYMAVYTNGKIKYKGTFEIDKEMKGELQYHKNHSNRIVPLAVKRYFVDNIPVETTIKNHLTVGDYDTIKNYGIYDFLACVKAKNSPKKGKPEFILMNLKGEKVLQSINRYYISTDGDTFIKRYKNGDIQQVEAHPERGRGYKVTIMNKYFTSDNYNIDYSYYIKEANKIINNIQPQNYKLF